MAFEDRCSPQSAPSPPGIPHSPQNTTTKMLLSPSATELNSSHSNGSSFTADHEMSISVASNGSDRTTPILSRVKEERLDSNGTETMPNGSVEQQTPMPITFSITNILSNSFGTKGGSRKSSTEKKSVLFRPYDDDVLTSAKRHELKSASRHISDVDDDEEEEINVADTEPIDVGSPRHNGNGGAIDFSNAARTLPANPQPIHFTQPIHPQPHHFSYFQTSPFSFYPRLSDDMLAKYPPLGNLCKTVSQIGQSTPTSITSKIMSATNANQKKTNSPASTRATEVTTPVGISPAKENQTTKPSPANALDSGMESSDDTKSETSSTKDENNSSLWPAWIYCTRYSDRPSSGPRYRKPKQPKDKTTPEEKRPRTAFSMDQLARLKREFNENRYLTERRRQQLSAELGLNEAQIKIWFQNKRAKIKKSTGQKNPLAMQLMAQGLYNHSTVPLTKEEEELEMRMNGQL